MSPSVSRKLDSVKGAIDNIEGGKSQWDYIWGGGTLPQGTPWVIISQLENDNIKGIWLYKGKPFNLHRYRGFYLPKPIMRQGRFAKERPDIRNTFPVETFSDEDQTWHIRRHCEECGGDMLYDHNENLYCSDCGLISEESEAMRKRALMIAAVRPDLAYYPDVDLRRDD